MLSNRNKTVRGACKDGLKEQRIAALRKVVERLGVSRRGSAPEDESGPLRSRQGLLQLEGGLPAPGLVCGALNEVLAAAHSDNPAAFGFMFAATAAALGRRAGPAVFVASRRALAAFGVPYGHGLAQLGLDPGRLLLVETKTDKDALWALEETLRSDARPAMVAGALAGGLDFTSSRRLNLAAGAHLTPLLLLRAAKAAGTNAAATRWRIAATLAACDRFGAFAQTRWTVRLERCRKGHTGEWHIEWNHVAHRFSVVESVADRASAAGARLRRAG